MTAEAKDTLQRNKYSRTGTGARRFALLSHKTYDRAGPEAFALLNEITDYAVGIGSVSKKLFMEEAMRDLSTTLCWGFGEQTAVYDSYDSASTYTDQYTYDPNSSYHYRLHMHHHHNIASRTSCAYLCSFQTIKMRIVNCTALIYHSGGTTTSRPPQHISAGMFPWTSQIHLSLMSY